MVAEMMMFSIENMLQHIEWHTLQKIVSFLLIIYIACRFLINAKYLLQGLSIFQTCSMPTIKCNQSIFYISSIFSVYNQSTPNLPALCLGLQMVFGLCKVYGKNGLLTLKLLFKPVVLFFKPETVEAVLSSPELIEKSWEYQLLRPWIGNGLITSPGKIWRIHRKLLTPTFHFSILDTFMPVFQSKADALISKILSRIQEPWIDVVPLMHLCALDIICETAMGVSINFLNGDNYNYADAIHNIEVTLMYRALRPWLYPDIIFYSTPIGKQFKASLQIVNGINEKILTQRKELTKQIKMRSFEMETESLSVDGKIRKPFLDLLLEHHCENPSFTEKDVQDHVATIMLGGHATTGATMSFVLHCLGTYPEIQREVHEELDAIFEDETCDYITRAALAKMKYLECVIKETMRLYPTVPFTTRESNRSFKVHDHTISEGTICVIFIDALHRDPVSFPDPEKFDPKRFSVENCVGRHPYAYTPFSAGPRNCIGQKYGMMEIKTVLACVLRRFRVIALDPPDKVLTYPNIIRRNVHPLRLRFEKR